MELKGALLQSMSDLNDPGALGYVGINVAFGKTTAQSSNPATADAAVNGAGAIQGLVADDADALPPEYSLTGTETNPWWEVDLGEDFNIDQLILYNGEVAQNLRVDIFDADRNSIYNSSHNVGANKEWQLAPSVIQTGQYVRVTHETASGVLSLEEVQVFAVPDDVLGDFNDDGSVDGTDFLAWQRGESPDPLSASDLADWEANYGMDVSTVAAAAATVPEPSTVLNLLIASITLIFHRGVIV
jgi:hypothetical protein